MTAQRNFLMMLTNEGEEAKQTTVQTVHIQSSTDFMAVYFESLKIDLHPVLAPGFFMAVRRVMSKSGLW